MIRVNEQRVCFGVDVFHHNLKAVETTHFGNLNLIGETLNEFLFMIPSEAAKMQAHVK